MLVEIILAFVLAIGVTYFITELTIRVKNKNDDLVVRTLVSTDQAIMYNAIMRDIYSGNKFKCSDLSINDNVFKYKTFTNILSEYSSVSLITCTDGDNVSVSIPMKVEQLSEDYSVNINMKNGSASVDTGDSLDDTDAESGGSTVSGKSIFLSSGEIVWKIYRRTGVAKACLASTNVQTAPPISKYTCYEEYDTIVGGHNRDHTVYLWVYGVSEEGYVMDSCTESSPCNFLEQYPHSELLGVYIVHADNPELTATAN